MGAERGGLRSFDFCVSPLGDGVGGTGGRGRVRMLIGGGNAGKVGRGRSKGGNRIGVLRVDAGNEEGGGGVKGDGGSVCSC